MVWPLCLQILALGLDNDARDVWHAIATMFDKGDVITGIDDRKVTKAADLALALDSFQVGDKVTLKVRRGDEGSQVTCCFPSIIIY